MANPTTNSEPYITQIDFETKWWRRLVNCDRTFRLWRSAKLHVPVLL